jgi:ATP-dependent RNA helicase DDX52/ROK1
MTDVFRLLTRSATFTKTSQKPAAPALSTLPIAPTAPAQPALTKSAKKRKRKAATAASTTECITTTASAPTLIAVPKELDFFGQGQKKATEAAGTPAKRRRHNDDDSEGSDDEGASSDEEGGTKDEPTVILPTSEEIKSTLRLHKLKFTIMSTPTPAEPVEAAEPEPEEKKKKSKKEKKEKKDKKENKTEEGPKKKAKRPELFIPPLTDFSQLRSSAHGYALSKRVFSNILAQGYSSPTEVQMGSLPILMKDNLSIEGIPAGSPIDLLTCAPTGSGKTLAYVVPLLNRLLREQKDRNNDAQKGVKAIILAPTKELVSQITNEIKKLVVGTSIKVSQFKKGARPVSFTDVLPEDFKDPSIKSDILVSTPMVLQNALESAGESCLTNLTAFILDEADVLLDELFREQTVAIWTALKSRSTTLRTSLWSATMPSSVEALVTTHLPDSNIIRLVVGIKDSSLPTITQDLTYCATETGKLHALRQLFTTGLRPPLIIFLQSIDRAQALYREVQYDLATPGRIAVLHAKLDDTTREQTMTRFRLGEVWILITTDLLARGMDFRGVRMVVNYDIPTSVASYIHRVGRTGRAGKDGKAVTYYTKEDIGYVKGIANVIKASGGDVQKWLLDALPNTTKEEKKKLKMHGVEVRRGVSAAARISTKSGAQRDKEWRRKMAVESSKRRKREAEEGSGSDSDDGGVAAGGEDEGDFAGFD